MVYGERGRVNTLSRGRFVKATVRGCAEDQGCMHGGKGVYECEPALTEHLQRAN